MISSCALYFSSNVRHELMAPFLTFRLVSDFCHLLLLQRSWLAFTAVFQRKCKTHVSACGPALWWSKNSKLTTPLFLLCFCLQGPELGTRHRTFIITFFRGGISPTDSKSQRKFMITLSFSLTLFFFLDPCHQVASPLARALRLLFC